jgi:nicotinamidase-related amidase
MTATLDPHTALILIDLQKGILRLPLVHRAAVVCENSRKLGHAFRVAGKPVIFVRVTDLHATRCDEAPPVVQYTPDFAEFSEELQPHTGDLVITKHSWDAFYGTDLDMQLRRRRVTGLVLAGIAASRAVESTARSAQARSYNITFARDAITDIHDASFEHSTRVIFPRLGEVRGTESIVNAARSFD